MNDSEQVTQAAHAIAAAIGRRDVEALAAVLAPGFVYRSPGGEDREAAAFLEGIRGIPGEILFVRLDSLKIDLAGNAALASGVQHARVRIEGRELDDRRAFVDWFVREEGRWRLRVAVDLPFAPDGAA